MQLDACYRKFRNPADTVQKVLAVFSRKPGYEMSADFDSVFFSQQNGVFGSSGVMPAVNTVQGGVVSALHAKFKPEFGPGAAGKKFHLLPIEAIGASPHAGPRKAGQSFELIQQGI